MAVRAECSLEDIGREQGPLYAGLKALHEHVSYVGMEEGEEKLAINEVWDVRVWETGSENVNIVDLTTTLNSPLPNGILSVYTHQA